MSKEKRAAIYTTIGVIIAGLIGFAASFFFFYYPETKAATQLNKAGILHIYSRLDKIESQLNGLRKGQTEIYKILITKERSNE